MRARAHAAALVGPGGRRHAPRAARRRGLTPASAGLSATPSTIGSNHQSPAARFRYVRVAASTLATLGVVFGDIGTSPCSRFRARGALEPTEADVHGVISLVLWTITLVVSLNSVALIMRADNDGEGGTMALIALVLRMAAPAGEGGDRRARHRRHRAVLRRRDDHARDLGLSSVEGLDVAAPSLSSLVVPVTLVVLVLLFGVQRYGTAAVGGLFRR